MLDQGYGIMPNKVLLAKNLSDKEKLLFVFISSLCAEKGYCRANNQYFSSNIGISKSNISRWLSSLEKKGYITITIDKNLGNKRTIAIAENSKTYCRKQQDPIAENGKHNIINIITTRDDIKKLLTQEEIEINKKPLLILWDMIECGHKCNADKNSIMKDIERIKKTLKVYKYWGEYSGYDRDSARMKIKELKDNIDAGEIVKNLKSKINNYLSPKIMRGRQKK